jgi:hypothetical protein
MTDDDTNKSQQFEADLAELEAGRLTNDYGRIYNLLIEIGRRRRVEAQPLVERFLASDDAELRDAALMVLTYDLRSYNHLETAVRLMTEDPDVDVRARGAGAVGLMMGGTNDRTALATLARIALNEREDRSVRASAYSGVLQVLGRSPREWFTAARTYPEGVDWALVRSFLRDSS